MIRPLAVTFSLCVVAALVTGAAAPRASITWSGAGVAGDWSDTGNWVGGVAPGAGDTAVFDATGAGNPPPTTNSPASLLSIDVQAGYTQGAAIEIDGAMTLTGDLLLDSGSSTSLNLNGNTLTVEGDATLGLDITGNGNLTFLQVGTSTVTPAGGAITGTFGVGTGTTVNLSGATTLNATGVALGGSTALNTSTGLLDVDGTITLSGVLTLGTGGADIEGGILLSMGGVLDAAGNAINLAGNISHGGGIGTLSNMGLLTMDGTGTQSLQMFVGSETFGDVVIDQQQATDVVWISSSTSETWDVQSVTVNQGILQLNTHSTVATGTVVNANGTLRNNVTAGLSHAFLSGGSVDSLEVNGGTVEFSADNLTLTFKEGQTVDLNGNAVFRFANTFGGATTLQDESPGGGTWTIDVEPTVAVHFENLNIVDSVAAGAVPLIAINATLTNSTNWIHGRVWTGNAGTENWNDAANWSGNAAPTASDYAVFNQISGGAFNQPTTGVALLPTPFTIAGIICEPVYSQEVGIDDDLTLSADLRWDGSGLGLFNLGGNTLIVAGDVVLNSLFDTAAGGALRLVKPGVANFTGLDALSAGLEVGGSGSNTSLTLPNGTTLSIRGLGVDAGSTLDAGVNGATIQIQGDAAISGDFVAGPSQVTVEGDWDSSGPGVVTFNGAGLLTFGGGAAQAVVVGATDVFQQVDIVNFAGVSQGGGSGTWDINGALDVDIGTLALGGGGADVEGLITIGGGTTASLINGGAGLQAGGGLTVVAGNGDYDPNGGTLTFDGTGTWTDGTGADDFGAVVVNGAGIAVTSGSDITTSTLTINGGTLSMSAGNTLDVSGLISVGDGAGGAASAVLQNGTGGIFVGGGLVVDKANDGDYNPNGGTLTFDGTGDWSGSGDDFGTVDVAAGGGTVTATSNLTTGGLTLTSGTLDLNGQTLTVTSTSTWAASTFVHNNGTVVLEAPGFNWTFVGGGNPFHNLTFRGPNTVELQTSIYIVGGTTLVEDGATFRVHDSVGSITFNGQVNVGQGASGLLHLNADTTFNAGVFVNTGGSFFAIGNPITIRFDETALTDIDGTILIDGAGANVVTLRSTVEGDQWALDLTGATQTFMDVRVKDSDASPGATANAIGASVSLGNNINWFNLTTDFVWIGSGTPGDWSDPANWNLGVAPTASDATVIFDATGAANPPPSLNSPATLGTFEVNSTYSQAGAIELTGNLALSGQLVLDTGAATSLDLNGFDLTVAESGLIHRPVGGGGSITFVKAGSTTLLSSATFNTTLAIGSGGSNTTVQLSGPTSIAVDAVVIDVGSTLDVGTQTLTLAGTSANPLSGGGTLTATAGTVVYTTVNGGGDVNVFPADYGALTINSPGETFNLTGTTAAFLPSSLTGGTLVVNGQHFKLQANSANPITVAGTLDASSGIVEYNGLNAGGNINIVATTYDTLLINRDGETFDLTGPTSAASFQVTGGTLSVGANALDLNGLAIIGDGSGAAGTAVLRNGAGGIFMDGNLTVNGGDGDYDPNGGTLTFDDSGMWTDLSGADDFGTVVVDGGGVGLVVTSGSTLQMTTLTIDDGTFALGAQTLDVNGLITIGDGVGGGGSASLQSGGGIFAGGGLTVNSTDGSYISGGATLTLDGSGTWSGASDFGIVIVNGVGITVTAGSNIQTTTLTINDGTLTLAGNQLDVNGLLTVGDGAGAGGTAVLQNGAGGILVGGGLTVNGTDGTYDANGGTLTFDGAGTWSGASDFGTVVINATAVAVTTVSNVQTTTLTINDGTLSIGGNQLDVNGLLTVGDGAGAGGSVVLQSATGSILAGGGITVNPTDGSFLPGGGTLTLDGAGTWAGSGVTDFGAVVIAAAVTLGSDVTVSNLSSTSGSLGTGGNILIASGGSFDLSNASFTGNGTGNPSVQFTGTGTMTLAGGDDDLGDVEVAATGSITTAGDGTGSGGNVTLIAGSTFNLGADFAIGGDFVVGGSASGGNVNLSVAGDLSGSGSLTWGASGNLNLNGSGQTITLSANIRTFNTVSVNQGAGGDVVLVAFSGGVTFEAAGVTVNQGVLDVDTSSIFTGNPALTIGPSGTLRNDDGAGLTHQFLGNSAVQGGGSFLFTANSTGLTFGAGTIFTVDPGATFTIQGTSGQQISLFSSVGGNQWTLSVDTAATFTVNQAIVQDSLGAGTATPLPAINSSDLGNNVNWNFSAKTTDWTGGGGSGVWSDPLNWNNGTPGSGDVVTLTTAVGGTSTVDIVGLDLSGLTLDGFTGTLGISQSIIVSGTTTVNTGTLSPGTTPFTTQGLTIGPGGTYAEGSGDTRISGNLTIDPAATWTNNVAGTVIFDGTALQSWDGGGVNIGAVETGGTGASIRLVNSDAAVTSLAIMPGDSLDLNGRLLTATVFVTVNGTLSDTTGVGPGVALDTADLTVGAGGTFAEGQKDTLVSGDLTVDPAGTWSNDTSGTLTFDGAGAQNWDGGGVDFGEVLISATSTVSLVNTNVQVTTLDIVGGGTLDLNGLDLTINGDGTTTTPLTVGGTYTGSGTTTFAGTSGGETTIPAGGGVTYTNLAVTGAETYRLGGDLSLGGTLTIGAGSTLDTSDGATEHTLTVTGSTTLDGTLQAGSSGATTLTFTDVDINGALDLNGGNPVDVDLSGNLDATAGAVTATGGTLTFTGSGAQTLTLDGGETFFNLDVSGAGGVTLVTGTLDIDGSLTVSSTLILGSNAVNLAGDLDGTGGTLTWGGSGTLTLDGAGQTLTIDTNSDTFDALTVNQQSPTDVVSVTAVSGQTLTVSDPTISQGILDLNVSSTVNGNAVIQANGTLQNDDTAGAVHQFLGPGTPLTVTDGAFLITAPGSTVIFAESGTVDVNGTATFTVLGAAGQQATLGDDADNTTQWTLDADSTATLLLNELVIFDMNGAGTGAPVTATNSVDSGDNTNVTFTTAMILVSPVSGLVTTELGAGTDSFTVVLSAPPTDDVTISVMSSDTGEGTVSTSSLTFTTGDWNVPQPVIVTGVDDPTADGDVGYMIQLGVASSSDPVYNGQDPSDVDVINLDDEVPGTLALDASSYAVNEQAGTATITVVRTVGQLGQVTVNYATADAGASVGLDYDEAVGTVTFTNGDTTPKTIEIPILEDDLVEAGEDVLITLSGVTGGATLGTPSSAALTISDGPGRVFLSSATYCVSENGGSVDITVSRAKGNVGAVDVTFNTVDATGGVGLDYVAATQVVNFGPGDTADKTVSITILDDGIVEGDETVLLSLSNPTAGALLGAPSAAVLTIVDHETSAGTLQFAATDFVVVENQASAVITVTRLGGAVGSVTVDHDSSDLSALDGSDYTAGTGMLTFGDGVVSQTFTVPILDDALVEGDETVLLSLSNPTGGAALGGPSQATLTIVDHETGDAGTLRFSSTAYSVTENGGTATITVLREGGSDGSVTVRYATADVSASEGADYTGVSGALIFADGQTSASIVVPILDDATVEGDETLDLTLTAPTGGASLGIPATAVLTIVDAETGQAGDLSFLLTALGVLENGGNVVIKVVRSGGSSGVVTVDVDSSDVTATAPGDYTAVSATLTLGDGEIERTFVLSIADDTVREGSETLELLLSGAMGGAVIVGTNPLTITILDDEGGGGGGGGSCGLLGFEPIVILGVLSLAIRRRRSQRHRRGVIRNRTYFP